MKQHRVAPIRSLARARMQLRLALLLISVILIGTWTVAVPALAQPATPSPVPSADLQITTSDESCKVEGQIPPNAAPYTNVTFTNESPEPYQVQIIELQPGKQAADFTPEVIASALSAEAGTDPVVRSFIGGPGAIQTGGAEEVILAFPAAGDETHEYAAICSIPGKDQEAIVQPLPASGPAGSGHAPEADVTITLTDDAIDMDVAVGGGPQLWEVTNEGTRPHDLVLLAVSSTVTQENIQEFMQENDGALPENVAAGGMRVLSPDETGWIQFDLPPGQYLAICDLDFTSRVFTVEV